MKRYQCVYWFVILLVYVKKPIKDKISNYVNQGFRPRNSSSYRPFVGWCGPATWPLGPPPPTCTLLLLWDHHKCPRLDFSLAFFSHNNMTYWQEFSYITLPALFSFYRCIIKPPGLLSYQDIIHRLLSEDETLMQNFAPSSSHLPFLIILNVRYSDLDRRTG